MSVNSSTSFTGPYTANGVTAVFPFDFNAMSDEEVQVLLDGAIVSPALYTVDRDDDGSGSIAFISVPASGTIFIASDPTFTETATFERFGPYFPDFINTPLWRAAVRSVYLKSQTDRSLKVPFGEVVASLPSAIDRASLLAAYDGAGNPIAVPPLAGPQGAAGPPGAGVSSPALAVGDSTTDNRAVFAAYDALLGAGKEFWLPPGTYRVASNLTITSLVRFMRGAKIKPDAGVTVTFNGGIDADPYTQIFDLSNALSYCWTKRGHVSQFSYGAVGNGVADDQPPFQHLVNNQLYIQHADIRPVEGLHKWASGIILNYGAVSNDYRSVRWMGPGIAYNGDPVAFGGLSILYTGWENAIEVQGARAFVFEGTELRGPFIGMFQTTGFGGGFGVPATDPNNLNNWLPAGANPLVLSRYKMCSGIHIDPRCGNKPTAAAWVASTLYSFGTSVTIGGNLYVQYAYPSGTSASSGGPTGTSTSAAVTDGSCSWRYAGPDTTSIAYTDTTYPAVSGASTQYNKPLSSRVILFNASIFGFGCNFAIKGCNANGNADFMTAFNCQLNQGVFAMSWGQNQARLNGVFNCGFGEAHTQFSTAVIGQQQGQAHLIALNTQLGNCLQMIDAPTASVGGGIQFLSCYGEVCGRMGNVRSLGPSGISFSIKQGVYSFNPDQWWQIPESIIDVTGVMLSIEGGTSFSNLWSPLTVKGDSRMCRIEADLPNPQWMGAGTPASITVGEAIMRRSTMDVVFVDPNQGPWEGKVRNSFQYSVTTGGSRSSQNGTFHARSDVATPIPFCARTACGSYRDSNTPYVVALGGYQQEITAGSITSWSQTGRIGTLTLSSTPTLSNAMNLGYEKGGIAYHLQSGNIYVVTNRVANVITLKQLNKYIASTGEPIVPIAGAGTGNWYWTPTGHYLPDKGYELTFTASSNSVTMALSDGTTAGSALQFPVGAVKAVINEGDALTPVLRANTAITAVVDGTITLAGNARASLPAAIQRAGLWFVPR